VDSMEFFRHFSLLALLVAVVGLSYIVNHWGKRAVLSLSSHAAMQWPSYKVFAATLIASGLLCATFVYGWLAPTFQLSMGFEVIFGAALVCALVAAIVPDSGGTQSQIHGAGAWTMAVLMLVLVAALLLTPGIGVFAKFTLAVLASYMLLDWILFVFVKWSRRFFLIFQSTYVLCFYLALLVVGYLG
jgi:hypothetical protein